MIFAPEPKRAGELLRLVTQPDHAAFAGRLLALWRVPELVENSRREDILFAAREHDNGWWESDSAPLVEAASGRPHDFRSYPRELKSGIWERGIDRFGEERPYAALLIAQHASWLHRDLRGKAHAGAFLAGIDERRARLLEETGCSEDRLAADYRWVDLSDLISLVACNDWREPFERHGFRGVLEEGSLHLEPFHLAGPTSFEIPCRRIPARPYRSAPDLAGELAQARWETFRIRIVPG